MLDNKVKEIFSSANKIMIDKINVEITFYIDDYQLDYERLCLLSKLLKTTKIDIETENEYGYYPNDVTTIYRIVCKDVDLARLGFSVG